MFTNSGRAVLDDEFWKGVWSYIKGESKLEIEMKTKDERLSWTIN